MDLSARLRAREPSRDLAPDVTLHGDFHPANLLVDDDGPVVIDLDNLATGPTERDLAIFAGRVILLGLKDGSRADEIVAAALRFPEHYVASGGARSRTRRSGGTWPRRSSPSRYRTASVGSYPACLPSLRGSLTSPRKA